MRNVYRAAIGVGAVMMFYAVSAGAWGVVYDPSNFIQNSLSATNSIRTVENQVRAYQAWLRQLAYNAKNIKDLKNYQTLDGINDQLRRLQAFGGALGQLQGGLNSARTNVTQQYRDYVSSNLTPQQYLQAQTQQNANTYGMAYGSYQQATQELEHGIPQSWNRVQQLAQQIPHIQGINENLKLMNEQMNQLLRQNNEILKFIAINTAQKNPKIAKQAEARQKAAAIQKELQQAQRAQDAQLNSWENQWRTAAGKSAK